MFGCRAVVKQQQNSSEVGKEVANILANGINRPRTGHDAGDHPPITPMKLAHRHEMDNDMYRIYSYIVRHFLATVSKIFNFSLLLMLAKLYQIRVSTVNQKAQILKF